MTLRLRPISLCSAVLLACAACGADPDPLVGGGMLGQVDAGTQAGADGGADAGSLMPFPTYDAGSVQPNPQPNADAGCGSVSAAAELVRQPVDIIWGIDGSGSMGDSILAVADNLSKFVTSIESSGTSAHTVLNVPANLTAAPIALLAASLDPARFQWVQGDVDSHNAFQILIDTFAQYQGFLRPNAPTHIIVVTDDDNRMPWMEFQTRMTALLGHSFVFHAIASPPTNPCSGASNEGPDYYALAQATGGQQVRLCDDWSTIFPILQAAVVASAPVPCDFAIPTPPNGETLDPNAVQVVLNVEGQAMEQFPRATGASECTGARAWYYDAPTPTKVMLCEDACKAVQMGGRVSLNFGCAPITVK